MHTQDHPSAANSKAGAGRHVLLAEDDSVLLPMYELAFSLAGFQVRIAQDGKQALDLAMQERPDVVVSDYMMPEMTGLMLLERLQADSELRTVPVVLISNLLGEQERAQAQSQGASLYIVKSEHKPVDVARIVADFLNTRETASPAQ
jgi:CheY-like chemotaxis protein